MSTRIRVFVSSTMKDLGNERRAVVDRLKGLNLEPVNAEGMFPDGGTSWDVLTDEIESCHLFVLLLGDSYGWIPTAGHGAGQGKSVTHLEADHARTCGLPILPFFKKLSYDSDATSDEAQRRDDFRAEIGEWSRGGFRGEFEWANELADIVGGALINLFQKSTLKDLTRARDQVRRNEPPSPPPPPPSMPTSAEFIASVRTRSAVLVAGAGFSVAAGLPTASVMAEVLARRVGLDATGDAILGRHSFSDLAAFVEEKIGRPALIEVIRELLNPAQTVAPTAGHLAAVRMFRTVVTTNFDTLFEEACEGQGLDFVVRARPQDPLRADADVTICKIDGTIAEPDNLLITAADGKRAFSVAMWRDVVALLCERPLAVVGHSLRDERMLSLLADRRRSLPGVYVSPVIDPVDGILLTSFGLEPVRATADSFLLSLASAEKVNTASHE